MGFHRSTAAFFKRLRARLCTLGRRAHTARRRMTQLTLQHELQAHRHSCLGLARRGLPVAFRILRRAPGALAQDRARRRQHLENFGRLARSRHRSAACRMAPRSGARTLQRAQLRRHESAHALNLRRKGRQRRFGLARIPLRARRTGRARIPGHQDQSRSLP